MMRGKWMPGLVAAVVLTALCAGCKSGEQQQKSTPAGAAVASAEPIQFIPSTMSVVMQMRWADMYATGEFASEEKQRILSMLKQDPKVQRIYEALGVDLFRDIQSAALGFSVTPTESAAPKPLFALKTSLSLDTLIKAIKENSKEVKVTSIKEGSVSGYRIADTADPDSAMYVMSSDGVLLAAESIASLRAAMDARKSGQCVATEGVLSAPLKALDAKTHFSLLVDATRLPKTAPPNSPFSALNDITLGVMTMNLVENNYKMNVALHFGEAAKSQTAAMQLQALKTMFGSGPQLKGIMDKLEITSEDTVVRLALVLNVAELKALQPQASVQQGGE